MIYNVNFDCNDFLPFGSLLSSLFVLGDKSDNFRLPIKSSMKNVRTCTIRIKHDFNTSLHNHSPFKSVNETITKKDYLDTINILN